MGTRDKVLIRYDPKGVSPDFWQRFYGYSKGKYRYPGLLDDVPGSERLARTLIAVPEDEVDRVKRFLRSEGADFDELGTMERSASPPEGQLRWDMSMEKLREGLEGLGEDMDRLGPFIRTVSERDAQRDVERYGY